MAYEMRNENLVMRPPSHTKKSTFFTSFHTEVTVTHAWPTSGQSEWSCCSSPRDLLEKQVKFCNRAI